MNTRFGVLTSALVLGATLTGCATDANEDSIADARTVEQLGITHFTTFENVQETTIIGFGSDDREVARVTLVHGGFELSGPFREDYPGMTHVVGRKLDVTIKGEPRFLWETADFTDTTHMPLEGNNPELATLFIDSTIRAELARWQVGFALDSDGEVPFDLIYSDATTFQTDCAGSATCGPDVRGFTVNTCGSGGNPSQARRYNGNSNQVDEVLQCCPSGSGGVNYNWAGRKLCPNSGTSTACGTATQACKGCGAVPQGSACNVWTSNLSWFQAGYICYNGANISTHATSAGACCSGLWDGYWCCGPAASYTGNCSAWSYYNYFTYQYDYDQCAVAAGCYCDSWSGCY